MANFKPRRKVENEYYNSLLSVIEKIEAIVQKYYNPLDPTSINRLVLELEKYAKTLSPWAAELAKGLIGQVNYYNLQDWSSISQRMGRAFRRSFRGKDPVFKAAKKLQTDQVDLITSIPRTAAQRVQTLARRYISEGLRHEDLAKRILATSQVAESRAKCIARTEIAKANTVLVAARAKSVGATHFIWRTAGDEIVRESHRKLNGKIFEFDKPPEIEGEGAHLPASFPNCRCWPEPILPKD